MRRFRLHMSQLEAAAHVNGMHMIAEIIRASERNGSECIECLDKARASLMLVLADLDIAIAIERKHLGDRVMDGICRILDCHYGTQFDPGDDTWAAIKVYRDGNPIIIDHGFATEEEAEDCATLAHQTDLQANGQFGVGA